MSGGQVDLNGEFPAWTGGLQATTGAITPDDNNGALFHPRAIRGIVSTSGGNIAVTLNQDDDTDANKKVTIVLAANTPETRFAIRKVWANGTTATGLTGFY